MPSDYFRIELDIKPSELSSANEAKWQQYNVDGGSIINVGQPPSYYYPDVINAIEHKSRLDRNYFNKVEALLDIIDLIKYLHGIDLECLSDRQLEFMEDTLVFLQTGKRNTPLYAWHTLIGDRSRYISGGESFRRTVRLRQSFDKMLGKSSEEDTDSEVSYSRDDSVLVNNSKHKVNVYKYITMWCKHKGGLNDLFYTLRFLYASIPSN